MIRNKIQSSFPHHLRKCFTICESLYIADYTEQTKQDTNKRAIELFKASPPKKIKYFTVNNPCKLEIDSIPFDNKSFTRPNGLVLSQCECVVYPHSSNCDSWILFLELKYSNNINNNEKNLNKARKQLFKTQYYYKSRGVFNKNNICYLLASLPMQHVPFANFKITQFYLSRMKKRHNVIIRFQNSIEIIDDKIINV